MQISQEILDFINSSLINNISKIEITNQLKAAGYTDEYKEAAFLEYSRQTSPQINLSDISVKIPSAHALIIESIEFFIKHFRQILISNSIKFLISLLSSIFVFGIVFGISLLFYTLGLIDFDFYSLLSPNSINQLFIYIVLFFVLILSLQYINGWVSIAFLFYVSGRDNGITIKQTYKKAWSRSVFRYFWTQAVLACVILLSALFFIFPGLILLFRFYFAPLIYITEDISGGKALLKSNFYIAGNAKSVLWRMIVPITYWIVLFIPFQYISLQSNFEYSAITILQIILSLLYFIISPITIIYPLILLRYLKMTKLQYTFSPSATTLRIVSLTPIIIFLIYTIVVIGFALALIQHL